MQECLNKQHKHKALDTGVYSDIIRTLKHLWFVGVAILFRSVNCGLGDFFKIAFKVLTNISEFLLCVRLQASFFQTEGESYTLLNPQTGTTFFL